MSLREKVLATMKSRDTESDFELYVTRTPGYLWALFFRAIHVSPITVTLISYVLGISAGILFYPTDLRWNILGMFLLIWANWYDCADGQLARMTNHCTLIGRVLDGFGGDVWFFSIYVSLWLRSVPDYTWWIFFLYAIAGFYCHSRQAAVGDYYRNIHLWILFGSKRSELDTYAQENQRYYELGWNRKEWFEKFYLFFYRLYTRGQEKQTPWFQKLYPRLLELYPEGLPDDLKARMRQASKPLMKYTNILNFDARVGVLFLSLFIGVPIIYPIFEIVVLGAIHIYMRHRHESFCRQFYNELSNE